MFYCLRTSGVPRGEEGAIRPGRHSEGGGKKRGKEKKKKKKKRKKGKEKKKENKGEACNFRKTIKWSILAAAPLCTYNLTF